MHAQHCMAGTWHGETPGWISFELRKSTQTSCGYEDRLQFNFIGNSLFAYVFIGYAIC